MVVSLSQRASTHTLKSVAYFADLAGSEDLGDLKAGSRAQQVRSTVTQFHSRTVTQFHSRSVAQSLSRPVGESGRAGSNM
eukprot:7875506-Pyramimonas_sp.AAC.1